MLLHKLSAYYYLFGKFNTLVFLSISSNGKVDMHIFDVMLEHLRNQLRSDDIQDAREAIKSLKILFDEKLFEFGNFENVCKFVSEDKKGIRNGFKAAVSLKWTALMNFLAENQFEESDLKVLYIYCYKFLECFIRFCEIRFL